MKALIAVLGGDGIGPEVVAEGLRMLHAVAAAGGHDFTMQELPFGGAAIDAHGDGLPPQTLAGCLAADAVLLGAIGGPIEQRPPADRSGPIEHGRRPLRRRGCDQTCQRHHATHDPRSQEPPRFAQLGADLVNGAPCNVYLMPCVG
jgi:hypothetical protein